MTGSSVVTTTTKQTINDIADLKRGKVVEKLINRYGIMKKESETFFLVDSSWYLEWQEYAEGNLSSHPGAINNSPLIQDGRLKSFLVQGFDFEVIPEKAWKLLKQFFGGGPDIRRKTIVSESGNLEVEVYPLRLHISVADFFTGDWDYSLEREFEISKNLKVCDLFSKMKDKLCPLYFEKVTNIMENIDKKAAIYQDIDKDCSIRLCVAKYGDKFIKINESSRSFLSPLKDLEVIQNQTGRIRFLIEFQRKDKSWPTNKKLSLNGAIVEKTEEEYIYEGFNHSRTPNPSQNFFSSLKQYMRPTKSINSKYYNPNRNTGMLKPGEKELKPNTEVTYTSGLVGFQNLGNTCYMNSALQALLHCDIFVNHFLKAKTPTVPSELSKEVIEVVKMFHCELYSLLYLNKLKAIIGKLHAPFRGYRQQDAEEFVTFFLDKLNDESESNFCNDTFSIAMKSTLTCLTCKTTSDKTDNLNILSLGISQFDSDITDVLDNFFALETLKEDDLWFCSNCADLQLATKQLSIKEESYPPILIIQLKRFTNDGDKITANVDFPFSSQLSIFKDSKTQYELFGVINHFGVSGGGHYTTYAKCLDGLWRSFNDSRVTELDSIPSDLQRTAYILFFRKV